MSGAQERSLLVCMVSPDIPALSLGSMLTIHLQHPHNEVLLLTFLDKVAGLSGRKWDLIKGYRVNVHLNPEEPHLV